MNNETYGALKRIIEEVKEKRRAKCHDINCVVNDQIGGNDVALVEGWIDEVAKEYNPNNFGRVQAYNPEAREVAE